MQRKWIFWDLLCLETNFCFDNQTEWYSWESSRLSPEVCFPSPPKLDVRTCRCTCVLVHSVCKGTCMCACSCVFLPCQWMQSCQWHQRGWKWRLIEDWWHVTSHQMIVSTCRFCCHCCLQLSESISHILWFLSFEIWRRWLLHQRRVDHRLAQEVWHRWDNLPLQETVRWTGVFRGAGSYHWKPGCHGNNNISFNTVQYDNSKYVYLFLKSYKVWKATDHRLIFSTNLLCIIHEIQSYYAWKNSSLQVLPS